MDAETKQPHGRTRSSSVPVSGAHRWRALLREPLSTELYQHTWPPVLVTAGKSQTLSGHPPPDPAGLLGQLDGELGLIARDDNVGQKSLSYTAQMAYALCKYNRVYPVLAGCPVCCMGALSQQMATHPSCGLGIPCHYPGALGFTAAQAEGAGALGHEFPMVHDWSTRNQA